MEGARSEMDICRLGGLLCGGETIAAGTATGMGTTGTGTGAGIGGTTIGGAAIATGTAGGTAAAMLLSGSMGLIELVEPRGVIVGVGPPMAAASVRELSNVGGKVLGTSKPRSFRLISLQAMLNSLMFIFPSESVSASALHMKYNKQHIRDVCVSREWESFYLSYLYKFLSVKFI